jgi:hypothetical protein
VAAPRPITWAAVSRAPARPPGWLAVPLGEPTRRRCRAKRDRPGQYQMPASSGDDNPAVDDQAGQPPLGFRGGRSPPTPTANNTSNRLSPPPPPPPHARDDQPPAHAMRQVAGRRPEAQFVAGGVDLVGPPACPTPRPPAVVGVRGDEDRRQGRPGGRAGATAPGRAAGPAAWWPPPVANTGIAGRSGTMSVALRKRLPGAVLRGHPADAEGGELPGPADPPSSS